MIFYFLKKHKIIFQFNYTLNVLNSGRYGDMVNMLINNQTDLVLADLSYSKTREEMIDFSAPFMNLGIGEIDIIEEHLY